MKNLYGDFWQNNGASDSESGGIQVDGLLLPGVSAKLASTKFVKSEVL